METLKNIVKYSLLSALVLLVVYPALHEAGHVLAAALLGAKVESVSLFPLPCVSCRISGNFRFRASAISLSGVLAPYIAMLCCHKKKERAEIRYSTLLLEICCIFSVCLNIAYAALPLRGKIYSDDDIGIIVANSPVPKAVVTLFFVLLLVLLLFVAYRRKNYRVFKDM